MRRKNTTTKEFRPKIDDPDYALRKRINESVKVSQLSRPAWLRRFTELGLQAMESIDWKQKLR